MINKQDLINSVRLIKTFCKNNECRNCPLQDIMCIHNSSPFEWHDNLLEKEISFYDKANYND